MAQLTKYFLDSQCPSEVCQTCFEAYPKSIWLAWLKCTNTNQHSKADKITVVASGKELVKVRPLPAGVTWVNQVKFCRRYQQNHQNQITCSSTCHYAHSNGEFLYWQWQVVTKVIFEKVGYIYTFWVATCLSAMNTRAPLTFYSESCTWLVSKRYN